MPLTKSVRLVEIDLLRFCAALSVVFFHYTFRGAAADALSPVSSAAMSSVFKYGYLGVNLFFMISGFVILMAAFHKDSREFVISRITRLYPEFWIGCLFTAGVIALWGAPQYQVSLAQFLINLTMVSNLVKVPSLDNVYWTLFIEIKFYFFVFLIIHFKKQSAVKFFLATWLAISYLLTWKTNKAAAFLFMPQFSAFFISGALFYLIYREGKNWKKIAGILATFPLALIHGYRVPQHDEVKYLTSYNFLIIAATLAVFYGIFFLIALKKKDYIPTKWIPGAVFLGCLTYPLYLLHQNAGYILFYRVGHLVNHEVLILITTALMMSLAAGVEKIREPLAQMLKNNLEAFAGIQKKHTALQDPLRYIMPKHKDNLETAKVEDFIELGNLPS